MGSFGGKHVSREGSSEFARDLVIMLVGIVIVGVVVFGGLSLFANLGGDEPDLVASESGSTTIPTAVLSANVSTTTTTTAASTITTTTTTTLPTTTSAPVAVVRDPAEVRVLVLNAVGVTGLAARVSSELGELGYQMLEPDNHSQRLDVSRIWYQRGFGPDALELKEVAIQDAQIGAIPDPEIEADIVVVLGASYQG